MKRAGAIETYETMRRAFRDLTDVEADGAATRARVLADASRDAARRDRVRSLAVPIAATLIATGAVSAALAVVHHWRAPQPATIESTADLETRANAGHGRAVRVIPFERLAAVAAFAEARPRPAMPMLDSDAEARAYARAHQAHFIDDAPARALDAWDAYLAAFPRGAFAPEAAYNRAICLVRLDRRAEATGALRRIAAARPGSYRREEALRLLDWLRDPVAP